MVKLKTCKQATVQFNRYLLDCWHCCQGAIRHGAQCNKNRQGMSSFSCRV